MQGNSFLGFVVGAIKVLLYFPFALLEHLFWLIFPRRLKSLKDEVVLVTGAANGIGREICRELVRQSDSKVKLVCWDINKRDLDNFVTELRSIGVQAFPYVVDLADRYQVSQIAKETKEAVGNVTMIINNAGIMPFVKLLNHKPEDIEKLYNTNVLAHYWTIQEFLPSMIQKKRGHIVAISSLIGLLSSHNLVAYSGTKFAVRGYMQGLEEEMFYHPDKPDIKFTTVYPAHTLTSNDMRQPHSVCKYSFFHKYGLFQPNYTARIIVDGMRKNYCHIYFPRSAGFMHVHGILPHKFTKYATRFIGQNIDDFAVITV